MLAEALAVGVVSCKLFVLNGNLQQVQTRRACSDGVRVTNIDGRTLLEQIVDDTVHARFAYGVFRLANEATVHVKVGTPVDALLKLPDAANVKMTLDADAAFVGRKLWEKKKIL